MENVDELYMELRDCRQELYLEFEKINSPSSLFDIQFRLAERILECENKIAAEDNKDSFQFHLDRLYALGDAIAWSLMEQFTIRQLGQYEAVRTSLGGQSRSYLSFMEDYRDAAKTYVLLFADLTRCITIGDIIMITSPDEIEIVEVKSNRNRVKTAHEMLSGRNGRQFSKSHWLSRLLKHGFEKLYGRERPTKVINVDKELNFHFDKVSKLIAECKKNGAAALQAESGLIYLAQSLYEGEEDGKLEITRDLVARQNWHDPVLAGTARLIESDRDSALHRMPLNFPIPLDERIALQEVDIQILGMLDVEYLSSLGAGHGYSFSYDGGDFIEAKAEKHTRHFNVRFLNDILINFATAESTVELLIALISQVDALGDYSEEERQYLEQRPKNKEEMVRYIEDNFVTVKFDSDGEYVAAFTMTGGEIDNEASVLASQVVEKMASEQG